MNIVRIALGNLRKRKVNAITLFSLIFITSMLCSIGLTISTGLNSFFDNKVTDLKGSHFSVLVNEASYKEEMKYYLIENKEIDKVQVEDCYLISNVINDKNREEENFIVMDIDKEREISNPKIINPLDTKEDNMIILPYLYKCKGYNAGDMYNFTKNDKHYSFKIYGFFEDVILGGTVLGYRDAYLFNNDYENFAKDLEKNERAKLISTTMKDLGKSGGMKAQFYKNFPSQKEKDITSGVFENVKDASTIVVKILAMLMIVFAAIIMIISLIIIRFSIINNIEEDYEKIGILEAIGFTYRQIISSIIIQYLLIGTAASIFGVVLTKAVTPYLSNIISSSVGLMWSPKGSITLDLINFIVVNIIVVMVSYLVARRTKKITPINAIRGGIKNHNFKKNSFPLHKVKININLAIGLKNMLFNFKKNIIIFFMVAALTFTGAFVAILKYNFSDNNIALLNMLGIMKYDIKVLLNEKANMGETLDKIKKIDGVEKISFVDEYFGNVEDNGVKLYVAKDYNDLRAEQVYEGRFPIYKNEISITNIVAKKTNKKIGDIISLEFGNNKKEFLITGIAQQIEMIGKDAHITVEGMKELVPSFQSKGIGVFIKDGANAEEVNNRILAMGKDEISKVSNEKKEIYGILDTSQSAISLTLVIIMIATVIIIILMLHLIIKTSIGDEKRNFAILKTLGYTTRQLIMQVTVTFAPSIILGSLVGGIIAATCTNSSIKSIISLFNIGIYNVNLYMNYSYIIIIVIGLNIISFGALVLIARRIKKVSPYRLISE